MVKNRTLWVFILYPFAANTVREEGVCEGDCDGGRLVRRVRGDGNEEGEEVRLVLKETRVEEKRTTPWERRRGARRVGEKGEKHRAEEEAIFRCSSSFSFSF